MQHPRPRPGARDRFFDASLGSDASESIPAPLKLQPRPTGSSFGKADTTGRSSGKHAGKRAEAMRPPAGTAWAWVTDELLNSLAWRSQSVNCRKLIDFLMLEHCRHAGQENGNLMATYDQLVDYGLTRNCIAPAIWEAEKLGLIRCRHGGRYNGSNAPNRYTLTWIGTLDGPPLNVWKGTTEQDVERSRKPARHGKRKTVCTPRSATTVIAEMRLPDGPAQTQTAENRECP